MVGFGRFNESRRRPAEWSRLGGGFVFEGSATGRPVALPSRRFRGVGGHRTPPVDTVAETGSECSTLAQRKQIQVRLTPEELDALDKLRDALAKLPTYDALAVTRSTVLRLCIARGADVLRDEIEAAKPKRKRRR